MDVFEILKSMVGCMYISDLKFDYKEKALKSLEEIKIDKQQKIKAYNYIIQEGI
jgi:hypothetical protein